MGGQCAGYPLLSWQKNVMLALLDQQCSVRSKREAIDAALPALGPLSITISRKGAWISLRNIESGQSMTGQKLYGLMSPHLRLVIEGGYGSPGTLVSAIVNNASNQHIDQGGPQQ